MAFNKRNKRKKVRRKKSCFITKIINIGELMINKGIKKLKAAAIQMESKNFNIDENLKNAQKLVEKAVSQGAELILFPEFMPTGYIFSKKIWQAAEPSNGKTVQWLKKNSKKYNVWLGTSFLEAEDENFYNTFVLTNPAGEEDGRVRKAAPCWCEAYYFKEGNYSHVIETEIGKIGVGICYENLLSYLLKEVYEKSVDILLMPYSGPTLMKSSLIKDKHVEEYHKVLKETPLNYANQLGIPVIMSNKCGDWISPVPLGKKQISYFPGFSTIVDSDGTLIEQMDNQEGIIISDVILDPERKKSDKPKYHGRWAWKGHWFRNLLIMQEKIGKIIYLNSNLRKKLARETSL